MRPIVALASVTVLFACSLLATSAHADAMDPALERLGLPQIQGAGTVPDGTACTNNGRFAGNITPTAILRCSPDHDSFRRLINQYGVAIAPTAMHSGRTTGFGGFHMSIEGAFTGISNDKSYWKNGTQGAKSTDGGGFSSRNVDPASALQVYMLKIRKGFPLGFEITGNVGYLAQTNIITGGADIRVSVFEGFRKGLPGLIPDLALGAGVRTISGTEQFNLTVASFDIQISKQLPLADSNILTPYVGFQQLWIFGDSGLIDFTPNTDAVNYCGYTGINTPANPDPVKKGTSGENDGQPVCNGGSSLDFNNNRVFNNVRLTRQRIILGLNYRYEMVFVGAQFMTDLVDPKSAGSFFVSDSNRDNAKLDGEKRQVTGVFEVGALF
jgi:hypothetical protein